MCALGSSRHCQEPALKGLSTLPQIAPSGGAIIRTSAGEKVPGDPVVHHSHLLLEILAAEFSLLKIDSFHSHIASMVFVNFVYTFLSSPYK